MFPLLYDLKQEIAVSYKDRPGIHRSPPERPTLSTSATVRQV